MDIDALTDSQVKKLIRELKNFISAVTFNIPQLGKYKKEESVSANLVILLIRCMFIEAILGINTQFI